MKNKKLKQILFFSKTFDFLNKYLQYQAVKSVNTIKTYRDGLTVFRHYVTDVNGISIKKFLFSDCTHEFLLDFMAYMRDSGCTENTCNNRLATIRAYLWYVANEDISFQSIALSASKVPFLHVPKRTKKIIDNDDLSALLSVPPNTKIGIRDRTIMVLLYDSAMRVSELLDLKIRSLNLKAATPYVRILGKGDKERIVALTDDTVGHLMLYMRHYHVDSDSDCLLFYTVIKGVQGRMSTGNVERLINKYADQIRPEHPGLPERIHPHLFRATRATSLYRDGVELELVSRILGHSQTETTRIYASPSVEMIRDAMKNSDSNIPAEEVLWEGDEDELARLCGLR